MLRTDYQPSDRFKTVRTALKPSDVGWGRGRVSASDTRIVRDQRRAWPALARALGPGASCLFCALAKYSIGLVACERWIGYRFTISGGVAYYMSTVHGQRFPRSCPRCRSKRAKNLSPTPFLSFEYLLMHPWCCASRSSKRFASI